LKNNKFYFLMRILDNEEIKEVNDLLTERHPMYYGNSKLHDVFPSLKVSRC
jgi:hypothetical protein